MQDEINSPRFPHPHPTPPEPEEPAPAEPKPPGLLRKLWGRYGLALLLALTLLSTMYIGFHSVVSDYFQKHGAFPQALKDPLSIFFYPYLFFPTLAYTAALMGFLTAHEMGHYFLCRRHGLNASLPYYLPNPILFGTFGAVIRIRSPIKNKRTLFDVGVAGPLSGFAVALPILILGLLLSIKVPAGHVSGEDSLFLVLGEPLIQSAVHWFLFPGGGDFDIIMSPLAMVGWFGCLVTAINLLPVSQLDGGHILYSVFGKRHYYVSLAVVIGMIVVAVTLQYYGWLFWALLVVLLGLRHPPLADEQLRLDGRRLILAAVALLVFIGCFIPVPIELPELFDDESFSIPEIADPPANYYGRDSCAAPVGLNA